MWAFQRMKVDFFENRKKIEGLTEDIEYHDFNHGLIKVFIKERLIAIDGYVLEMKIKKDRVYIKTKYQWNSNQKPCQPWSVLIRKNPSKSWKVDLSTFLKQVEQEMLMYHEVDNILLGD